MLILKITERPAGCYVHHSGGCKSGESYREGFYPAKVEFMGCSNEQPFLLR